MTQRIQSLDLARGFTVLFIPTIHTVMVYSHPDVHTSWLGYVLTFIAEGPGAQVFMTIMGIAMTFKPRYDCKSIAKRSLILLLAGHALSTAKFVLPFALGVLPEGVQRDLQLLPGNEILQLLLLGDILHFAALALPILHGMYRLKNYWFWSLMVALLILFISPFVWDAGSDHFLFHYVLQLATGQPPRVFFPWFPWLVYPLLGSSLGYFLKRSQHGTFRNIGWVSILCAAGGWAYAAMTNQWSPMGFYRTYPGETLLHIGVVILTLWFWHWIAYRFNSNAFLKCLQYCSRHITVIYIVQWVFICWWLPLVGYQTLDTYASVMLSVYTTAMTFAITEIILLIKQKYAHAKNI